MSSTSIYSILSSKSSNHHLINRYIRFVTMCNARNQATKEYTEIHHICPKADDLFPEYSDFSAHPWNKSKLTAREHLIAHVMLWKIFGGSQIFAIDCMLDKFNENTNPFLYSRKIPSTILIRYHAKIREATKQLLSETRKGYACYKDEQNNKYVLHKDNTMISELSLVGNNLGHTHSETSKRKMSETKFPNKIVTLYFLDSVVCVKLFSEEYDAYISQGWTTERTASDIEYCRDIKYNKVSVKLKGTMRYCTRDGKYVGRFHADDPRIKELDLVFQITENNRKQYDVRQQKAVEAITGTNIYNNGIVEARFVEQPDDPQWKLGRLPRSESHSKNQKEAAAKAMLGTKAWHNGIVCKRFPEGYNPGEGWALGLLPRKKSQSS